LNQLSLNHKNHFFNAAKSEFPLPFTLSHEGNEGRDYASLDPTKTQPTKGTPNHTIRIFLVSKRVPLLNSDVLKIIFDSLCEDHYNFYHRKTDSINLCLTCRHWWSIAQPYLLKTQQVLGVDDIYPNIIFWVDFQNKFFMHGITKRFSFSKEAWKAWVKYGREFLDILSQIPGTSRLMGIYFNYCFNTFHPSEWSRCLHRCFNLRGFSFQGRECHWEDIKLFLMTFQTRSRVSLEWLEVEDISDQGIQSVDVSPQNQMIQVRRLTIYRIRSNSLLSNVLSFISPNLESVSFHKTSFDIESVTTLFNFVSSLDPTKLEGVKCSLMPPSLNSLLQPDDSLIWPHFSSPLLQIFEFDGGAFGTSAITSDHISMFSEMPNLERLGLKYCLDDLQPTSFSSLADFDKWKSLYSLEIKYKFGDPKWEREDIDQLVQHFQSSILKVPYSRSQPGYTCLVIQRKPTMNLCLGVEILEGGDESDDWEVLLSHQRDQQLRNFFAFFSRGLNQAED
jgi:hypothetical protein